MKITCENCGSKYSIEDDKIVGKTFKVRCRKCSHINVARGEVKSGGAPAWHAVQNGQQIGPFESGEILRRRAAGDLDDGSYVWREGFAEWQVLGAVGELRAAIAAEPKASAAAPALTRTPAATPAHAVMSAPAADVGRLHGERNETSALFTLDGLSKLAGPKPAAQPAA
jgi:predicted Zn finger-like uncharacterized protein